MAFRPLKNTRDSPRASAPGLHCLIQTDLAPHKEGDHPVPLFASIKNPLTASAPQSSPTRHAGEPSGAQPNDRLDAADGPNGLRSTHSGPHRSVGSRQPIHSLGLADCRGLRLSAQVDQRESQPAQTKPQEPE